jgi:putative transposase
VVYFSKVKIVLHETKNNRIGEHTMSKDNAVLFEKPEISNDLLTEVIRSGARKLLRLAVEAEVTEFLSQHQCAMPDGRSKYVRNGFLPERGIQTGIGEVPVAVPRVRDRETIKSEMQFRSSIVPRYLRRSVKMQEFLPLLYLKGISTGDFKDALSPLMGDAARNLSSGVISRLKACWEEEFAQWNLRSLAGDHYVYWWADGIYFQARMEEAKDCVLVIIGVTADGTKELIAITDGYRESKESWLDLLKSLQRRGLKRPPKVAVGDGALGFWAALNEGYPETVHQRCWVHKTANVLNYLPKNMQAQAKSDLEQIWMADTRNKAYKAFQSFQEKYRQKYPKTAECLQKDKEELLAFYDFPAEHWKSLRTTNPIESTFATVRHRTKKAKGCFSRQTILSMVFKLCGSAEKRWHKIAGFQRLGEVVEGVKFVDGIREDNDALKVAA